MLPVPEAIRVVLAETPRLEPESVALAAARGRVLAEDVIADSDLPPFDRALMDGYAVRAEDTSAAPVRLRIVGEAAAGRGWRGVLRAGAVVNAAMMAALASFGYARVRVGARPRVAVLATGTELVAVDAQPGPDQIRDSNTYSLLAYAEAAGAAVEHLPFAGDEPELLQRLIAEAAARADALILSGGVSMGVYDFTKAALRALGAQIFFERVSLRPGKPTVFARLGRTLVFGLPGNPVSVSVTFNLFARTALRAMQGASDAALVEEQAVLVRALKGAAERASYLPARLCTDEAGQLLADPLKWGGSSDFIAFARATALIIVPEGVLAYDEGTRVCIVRLPE